MNRPYAPLGSWICNLAAVLGLLGCQPEIGDPCRTTADCTDSTDRICDATQPGGYCTVFNCEPDTCPEEAACVAFRSTPATAVECNNTQEGARLQRTFCMKTCNQQSDCRPGYVCMDVNGASTEDNPWSALVIESYGALVCVLPYSGPQPEDERETDVCSAAPATTDADAAAAMTAAPMMSVPMTDGGAVDDADLGDAG